MLLFNPLLQEVYLNARGCGFNKAVHSVTANCRKACSLSQDSSLNSCGCGTDEAPGTPHMSGAESGLCCLLQQGTLKAAYNLYGSSLLLQAFSLNGKGAPLTKQCTLSATLHETEQGMPLGCRSFLWEAVQDSLQDCMHT